MKTTLLIDDDLVAAAKELDINMSAVARDAIARRVAELRKAKEQGMSIQNVQSMEGEPVSFWGRFITQHPDLEICAYLTAKGAIVVTDLIPQNDDLSEWGERISSITPSAEEYINAVSSKRYDPENKRESLPGDFEFLTKIAEAAGVSYHRPLDI